MLGTWACFTERALRKFKTACKLLNRVAAVGVSGAFVFNTGFVKLIDFGLAHHGEHSKIAKSRIMAGTPVYLPPEVLREHCVSDKLVLTCLFHFYYADNFCVLSYL